MVKRKTRFGLTEIVSEHRGQWKKIWMLAVNDLIKKYKGSVMGPYWALIKPSFTLFILWFAFTVGIRNQRDGKRLSEVCLYAFRIYSVVFYK